MQRRDFLARFCAAGAAAAALAPAEAAAQEIFALDADLTRLKLDVNANRSKVRFVALLSPT